MSKLRLCTIVGALVFTSMASACSSSGSSADSVPDSSVVTTVATTEAPTTTEAPEATEGAPSSAEAASLLVDAWNEKNREAAARIADPAGVDGIFETPDPDMWLRSCTTDDSLPEGGCIYRTATGLVQINTEKREHGWVVSSAVFDPADNGTGVSGDAPDDPEP